MTWIKTIPPLSDGDEALRRAAEGQRSLYWFNYVNRVADAWE